MRILIVDENILGESGLRGHFTKANFVVTSVNSSSQALMATRDNHYDLIIASPQDLLNHNFGLDLKEAAPLIVVIALAERLDLLEMLECLTLGVDDYFYFNGHDCKFLIDYCLMAKKKLERWRKILGTLNREI